MRKTRSVALLWYPQFPLPNADGLRRTIKRPAYTDASMQCTAVRGSQHALHALTAAAAQWSPAEGGQEVSAELSVHWVGARTIIGRYREER